MNRRAALRTLAASLAGAVGAAVALPAALVAHGARADRHHAHRGSGRSVVHPDPRPDVTAAGVLPDDRVTARHRDAYAAAREIPQVLDGIYCHCDCADRRNLRSLLSCFETEMPMSCGICTGEARLALRRHQRGDSLDEIRRQIDRAFG